MGVLAHFLEEAGLPTTQISLIRKHTEIIKPPRALWVPFELGRPLGIPNDAAFQNRVLLACLKLLEAKEGPVLEDFPEDIPLTMNQDKKILPYAINIDLQKAAGKTEAEKLQAMFREEMLQLLAWHELSVQKHGRTTVGVSGIDLSSLAGFLCDFLNGEITENHRDGITLPELLKLATEDVKAFYFESMAAKLGQPPESKHLSEWFWEKTAAARILFEIQKICVNSDDQMLKLFGQKLLIPIREATHGE